MLATIHSTQVDPDHDTPVVGVLYIVTAVNMIAIGNVFTLSSFIHTEASCGLAMKVNVHALSTKVQDVAKGKKKKNSCLCIYCECTIKIHFL